jgi:hypothetical protein
LRLAAVHEFETEQAAYKAEGYAHEHFQQFAHQKEWFQVAWSQVADWAETSAAWRRSN